MLEARIDLDAIAANTAVLRRHAGSAGVMAVVKADGYGHGMLPAARAALAGGASWLGVATIPEGLALRAAGFDVPVLAWLIAPGEDYAAAVRAGIDVSVADGAALRAVAAAARETGAIARIHLKADTGLGRGGAPVADWPDLVDAAAKLAADDAIDVVGVWSHLAHADDPRHPVIDDQRRVFDAAIEVATRAGLTPQVRHLANSAATLTRPELGYDLVRPGIAVYGLTPGPRVGATRDLGLRPAMTLVARLALVKRVPAGQGVSYGHRYHTTRETTLGLVPAGYADGVPRAATNRGEVFAAGRLRRIAGTVCMDQFVLDLGDDPAAAGDEVVLWGPGDAGEPTADDWAGVLDTINYEIVTRVGPRARRVYSGRTAGGAQA
jgi:alanine racemase